MESVTAKGEFFHYTKYGKKKKFRMIEKRYYSTHIEKTPEWMTKLIFLYIDTYHEEWSQKIKSKKETHAVMKQYQPTNWNMNKIKISPTD